MTTMNRSVATPQHRDTPLADSERALLRASQAGLPLLERPFAALGAATGLSEQQVLAHFRDWQHTGLLRRVAAVPNHYALGYVHNGMTVWDVDDAQVDVLGERIAQLGFVSHCYRRPRHLPDWPYNLFAMVHGRSREETDEKVAAIAAVLGDACRDHEVLWSTRILKKTGLRIGN
jgi:DNA-binding Lrp family transcriptional regulator